MTPQQVVDYLEKKGISRADFARTVNVTEAAISFWLRQGWMTHERQCQVQLALPGSGLRARWEDVPAEKRPAA